MQTCPFCGQNYRVEMTRIEGAWAFFECTGCEELSVVRGSAGFELPELVLAKPQAAPVISSVIAASPAPVQENWSPWISGPDPHAPRSDLRQRARAWAISGTSLVLNAVCAILVAAALIIPFSYTSIRDAIRSSQGPAPAPAAALAVQQLRAMPSEDVSEASASAAQRAPAAVESPAAPESARIVSIAIDRAILREGPGSEFKKIASATQGARFEIVQTRAGWHQVKPSDPAAVPASAWIRADLVTASAGEGTQP